mgnify:CR=1 FL=1
MKKTFFFSLAAGLFMLLACNPSNGVNPEGSEPGNKFRYGINYSNQVILDWNQMVVVALGGENYQHSLLASRMYAMVHVAMHDALNAVAPAYTTYALQRQDAQAHPVAAAAVAAHTVLSGTFPQQKPSLDSALTISLAKIPSGDALSRGIELGKEAGAAILARRQNDGAFQDPIGAIEPSQVPGVYQAVPPFNFVFAPFWKTMQPFSLQTPDQFRVSPQPALTSTVYAKAYNEVKALGEKNSPTRTADQTFFAKFWYEFSEKGWNRVARVAAADRKLDLLSTARLFALVNMAMADSYTAGWDAKFHYNFWRPFTAIRGGATDGNAATAADADWEPLMPTPPVHDYPSTHSTLGGSAATVLALMLGDKTTFTMTSPTADPASTARTFCSFSQAAIENAESRVVAGIHFRFSCEAGLKLGNDIGKWTFSNYLKPRPYTAK